MRRRLFSSQASHTVACQEHLLTPLPGAGQETLKGPRGRRHLVWQGRPSDGDVRIHRGEAALQA